MKNVVLVRMLLMVVCVISCISFILTGCASPAPTVVIPSVSVRASSNDSLTSTQTPGTKAPSGTTAAVSSQPPPKTTVAKTNSSVSAVPSVTTAKPGDSFNIAIRAKNDQPARGIQFAVKWDPAKVQCVSTEPGRYFSDFVKAKKGSIFSVPDPPVIDNTAGIFPKANGNIKYLALAMTGAKDEGGIWLGVTGTGDIYTLYMKVNQGASGTAEFTLADVILIDATLDSNDMKAAVENGKITISP